MTKPTATDNRHRWVAYAHARRAARLERASLAAVGLAPAFGWAGWATQGQGQGLALAAACFAIAWAFQWTAGEGRAQEAQAREEAGAQEAWALAKS